MRLPTEIVQQVYFFLTPIDFNAARHTCRSWFYASLDRMLLVYMLKKGGWWSSILRILTPMSLARDPDLNRERMMSRWISRESNLLHPEGSAFVEVGFTDFSAIVPGFRAGAPNDSTIFTVSLCGRFVMAAHDRLVFIYELNHVCPRERTMWSMPLRRRQGMPLGFLRPVASIICPRRVVASSMDTSAGRHAAAFLMEGRIGMVVDLMDERTGTPSPYSENTSNEGSGSGSPNRPNTFNGPCICHERSPYNAAPTENGPRSVYRNICHPDDPPHSVAICPQRNCVAFGCSAGIELH